MRSSSGAIIIWFAWLLRRSSQPGAKMRQLRLRNDDVQRRCRRGSYQRADLRGHRNRPRPPRQRCTRFGTRRSIDGRRIHRQDRIRRLVGKVASTYEIEIDHRRVSDTARWCSLSSTAPGLTIASQQASEPRSVNSLQSATERSPQSTASQKTPAHRMKSPSNPMRTGHTSEVVRSVLAA